MDNNNVRSEALLDAIKKIVEAFKAKGTIPEEDLAIRLQKLDINSDDIDYAYDEIEKAGITITSSAVEEASKSDSINKLLSDVSVDDAVKLYLRDIGRYALLSADEEIELAKKTSEGDEAAKKETRGSQYAPCGQHRQEVYFARYVLP